MTVDDLTQSVLRLNESSVMYVFYTRIFRLHCFTLQFEIWARQQSIDIWVDHRRAERQCHVHVAILRQGATQCTQVFDLFVCPLHYTTAFRLCTLDAHQHRPLWHQYNCQLLQLPSLEVYFLFWQECRSGTDLTDYPNVFLASDCFTSVRPQRTKSTTFLLEAKGIVVYVYV